MKPLPYTCLVVYRKTPQAELTYEWFIDPEFAKSEISAYYPLAEAYLHSDPCRPITLEDVKITHYNGGWSIFQKGEQLVIANP